MPLPSHLLKSCYHYRCDSLKIGTKRNTFIPVCGVGSFATSFTACIRVSFIKAHCFWMIINWYAWDIYHLDLFVWNRQICFAGAHTFALEVYHNLTYSAPVDKCVYQNSPKTFAKICRTMVIVILSGQWLPGKMYPGFMYYTYVL